MARPLVATAAPVLRGVRTPIHDTGPASAGDAVVFVHGNPGPMDDWADLVPAVAPFTRAIAMDLPGFGEAGRPASGSDLSARAYAAHIDAVLQWAGVRRAHLVLHDFGGAWGLSWARDHPKSTLSLSLIDTGVLRGYRWHTFARIWQTPVVGELLQVLAGPRAIRAVMNRDNPRPFPGAFTGRVTRHADLSQKLAVLAIYRAARDAELAFVDPHVDVPVCVVWGGADRYVPAAHAEAQRQFFPRAEVHVLDGLGHWPFVDDPAAVRDILVPFLRRHTG